MPEAGLQGTPLAAVTPVAHQEDVQSLQAVGRAVRTAVVHHDDMACLPAHVLHHPADGTGVIVSRYDGAPHGRLLTF